MTTPPRRSIGRWLLLAVWCAVLFLVPSALVIDRGAPPWAAALVGALAFPLAPVAWHVLAERARTQKLAALKVTPKATLTVLDRFVLRTIVIALIACAPWFAIARGRSLRAVWHHAGWPVHAIIGPGDRDRALALDDDRELLRYVPADAELIVWIHGGRDLEKLTGDDDKLGLPDAGDDSMIQGVAAYKHGELFAVVQAKKIDDGELDTIDQAEAKKWFGHELHFEKHRIAQDAMVIVTKDWDDAYVARALGRTPPAKALIDKLPAADDAMVVSAALPRTPIAGAAIREATAVLRVDLDAKKLVVSSTIRAGDAATAAAVVAAAHAWIDQQKRAVPESCREPVGALLDGIAIKTKGDVVSIDTAVAPEKLFGAVMCSLTPK